MVATNPRRKTPPPPPAEDVQKGLSREEKLLEKYKVTSSFSSAELLSLNTAKKQVDLLATKLREHDDERRAMLRGLVEELYREVVPDLDPEQRVDTTQMLMFVNLIADDADLVVCALHPFLKNRP